jgi:hypothetical protein
VIRPQIDAETRGGRDHVRITLAMTVVSADVAGALAGAWQAFREKTRRGPAGQPLYLLTELLTRLIGTGETERDADDGRRDDKQVGETRRDAGDVQDARRMAHNPEVAGSNPAPLLR